MSQKITSTPMNSAAIHPTARPAAMKLATGTVQQHVQNHSVIVSAKSSINQINASGVGPTATHHILPAGTRIRGL